MRDRGGGSCCERQFQPRIETNVRNPPYKTRPVEIGLKRTTLSTSFGLDNHVPSPIWGIFSPVLRVRILPKDIVICNEVSKVVNGGGWVDYREASMYDVNMTFQEVQPEPARFDYPGRSRGN